MGILASLRVMSAMVQVSAPSLVDAVRGDLTRAHIDERTRWFGRRVVELLDVKLTSRGADQIPTDRAYVYMSNHQSHLDIPILYATLPSPTIRMLAKKELFSIPLWGRGLRAAEFIEVDRGDHARAVESIERAAELVRDGVSIWLAPEGTRSRTGKIGTLKKGGFHLALATGTPIVPVAIRGTIDILRRGTGVMQRGCAVDVEIGAPISVEGRSLAELSEQVGQFLIERVERRAHPGTRG